MMTVNTDALGQAIAAQQDGYLVAMLAEANETIAAQQEQLVAKADVIRQYATMAREQAIQICRLHCAVASIKGRTVADAIRDGGYEQ